MIYRPYFFATVRSSLFGGRLRQPQVNGLELLLAYPCADDRRRAYCLATAYHETAKTMQPIYERGTRGYFAKYEPGTRVGRMLGNTAPGDGYRYRGRGFVQLTGRGNYARVSEELGIDLVGDPDTALVPAYAVAILYRGLLDGWFTGRSLFAYINATKTDFVGARRVVNGLDRAATIAGYAVKFHAALSHTEDA